MSYILDALRKSDQQRRLGAVPTLQAASVAAAPPERSPMLLYGLLTLLLIVATVTAVAWLRPRAPEAAVLASSVARPPELPVRQPAAVVVPQPVLVAAAQLPPLAIPPVAVPIPAQIAPAVRRKAPTAAMAESPASSELPASMRKQLPPISVAVHAYSSTPADRLVSINGRMLREGDTMAPDLKLEQITPDGMIFAYRGYRFRRSAQ